MRPATAATTVSLRELADLAIGTPEVGAVNFTALHTLLVAMLKNLHLQDTRVDFQSLSPEQSSFFETPPPRVSLSTPQMAVPKERRRSTAARVPAQTLESQVKNLGGQVQDLGRQVKAMDSQMQGVLSHLQSFTTLAGGLDLVTKDWLGEQERATSMTQMGMPEVATLEMVTSEMATPKKTTSEKTTSEEATLMPSMTKLIPKMTRQEPGVAMPMPEMETPMPKTAKPVPDMIMPMPRMATLMPEKAQMGLMKIWKDSPQVRTSHPLSRLLSSSGCCEPQDHPPMGGGGCSWQLWAWWQCQALVTALAHAAHSIFQAMELLQSVIEDVKTLKEALAKDQEKAQEFPDLSPMKLLQRIEEVEKVVRDREEILGPFRRKMTSVPHGEVTMVTWEELEQAITDGLRSSQMISESTVGPLKHKKLTSLSSHDLPSGISTKRSSVDPSLDSASGLGSDQALLGTSGPGALSEGALSRGRGRHASAAGFPGGEQQPRVHDEGGLAKTPHLSVSQFKMESDHHRPREGPSIAQLRREEQEAYAGPVQQGLPSARDGHHHMHPELYGGVSISPDQVSARPGHHELEPSGMDQLELLYPSTYPHGVFPFSMSQPGVMPSGVDEQGLVLHGMGQHDVVPPWVPGKDQQGLELPSVGQPGMFPPSTYQPGVRLPDTNQLGMEWPGIHESGVGPLGTDQHGFPMFGMDQQGLVPPTKDQHILGSSGLMQVVTDQQGFVLPSLETLSFTQPGIQQQDVSQPGIGQPGLVEPAGQPGLVQPGAGQPGLVQPGAGQPGLVQPGAGQPGLVQPGAGQPGLVQPGAGQPGLVQPGAGQPGLVQPGAGQPGLVQPGAGQPGLVQPGAGQPGLVQPGAGQPGLVQPGLVQPGAGQPGLVQPGLVQPGLVQPGAGQPGVVQPGVAQPGVVQPGPGLVQPGVVQPGAGQPGLVQPGAGQPGVVQPGAGQPGAGLPSPGAGQPGVVQPGVAQPGLVQAGAGQPGLVQPGAGLPGLVQPGAGQPGVVQPGAGQPGVVQPGAGQPGVVQPGAGQPGVVQPGAGQPGVGQPGLYLQGLVQPGEGQPGLVQPGAGQPGLVQPGIYQQGLVQPRAGQPGLVLPGIYQQGLVRPGAGQPGLVRPGAGQPGLVRPGAGQPGLVRPGASQPGLVQPAGQPGLVQPGIYQQGLVQPSAGQHALVQPRADQHVLVQPRVDQHVLVQPRADQHVLVQPRANQHGLVQIGAYPAHLMQPGAYPHRLVQPEVYPHGIVHPGAFRPGFMQPSTYQHDFVQPGIDQRGVRQPSAGHRGLAPSGTELPAFPVHVDSPTFISPHQYQHGVVPSGRDQYRQLSPLLAKQGLTLPGINREGLVPAEIYQQDLRPAGTDQHGPSLLSTGMESAHPDQQHMISSGADQHGQIDPRAHLHDHAHFTPDSHGLTHPGPYDPRYPGVKQYVQVDLDPNQPGIYVQTTPSQEATFSRSTTSSDYLNQVSSERGNIQSERRDSLDKVAPSFPIAVETFRLMGELVGLYMELKESMKELDEDKAGQTDLEKIQFLLGQMVQKTIPPDLLEELKDIKTLTKEIQQEKVKLDKVQRILEGEEDQEMGKEVKAGQLGLQLGVLRVTVADIEKELAELRDSQERGKVSMEHSVSEASLYLQDQLDKLRTIIENMLASSSTLLSMSMVPQKTPATLAPGEIDPEATCPACSLDLSHQVSTLVQRYEKLQMMVSNLAASRPSKKAKLQSQDEELLGHVQRAILQVQGDCEKLNTTTSSLLEDHRQKQKDIDVLYQGLEKLEKEKANREHLEIEIDVKADKSALAAKVSRVQFDATTEQLNHMMQQLVAKMSGKEQDWQKMLDKLLIEMDSKLDRLELDPVKQLLEDRWKSLRQQLKERSPLYQADEAACMRRQLLAHFHCLSCDRPLETPVTGQIIPVTPVAPSLPGHRSTRPYTVFELEQVRQQSRNLKLGGTTFPRAELAPLEQSVGRLRSMHSKMLMDIEKVQIYFGGSVKASSQMIRELLQAQCLSSPCYKRMPDMADYSYSTVPRHCGGSHTLTYPYRRNRLQHLPQSLYAEEIQIAMKHNEVDILGLDGHIYKGRMDRLPGIPSKEGSGITKQKAKTSRFRVHRQPSLSDSGQLPSRPQSAQMLAGNTAALRQRTDRPVSSEGRFSQSNLAHSPTPREMAAGLEMHMDMPPGEGQEEPTRGPRSSTAH
ncbi:LOW QUALITY PROTEIN: glutamine-rich protein 2 [Rhynchonycteris naso]